MLSLIFTFEIVSHDGVALATGADTFGFGFVVDDFDFVGVTGRVVVVDETALSVVLGDTATGCGDVVTGKAGT